MIVGVESPQGLLHVIVVFGLKYLRTLSTHETVKEVSLLALRVDISAVISSAYIIRAVCFQIAAAALAYNELGCYRSDDTVAYAFDLVV